MGGEGGRSLDPKDNFQEIAGQPDFPKPTVPQKAERLLQVSAPHSTENCVEILTTRVSIPGSDCSRAVLDRQGPEGQQF